MLITKIKIEQEYFHNDIIIKKEIVVDAYDWFSIVTEFAKALATISDNEDECFTIDIPKLKNCLKLYRMIDNEDLLAVMHQLEYGVGPSDGWGSLE